MKKRADQRSKTTRGTTYKWFRLVLLYAAALTSHVLMHHVRSMFYKQAEHGGATGPSLQPQQNWRFFSGLSDRFEHGKKWDLSITQWPIQFINYFGLENGRILDLSDESNLIIDTEPELEAYKQKLRGQKAFLCLGKVRKTDISL